MRTAKLSMVTSDLDMADIINEQIHIEGDGTAKVEPNVPVIEVAAEKTFNLPEETRKFIANEFPEGVAYTNEVFLRYHAGYWSRLDERCGVRRKIAEFLSDKADPANINGILSLLKDFQALSGEEMKADRSQICLRNGTMDTKIFTLKPHRPKNYLQTVTDIPWHDNATCPRWLQFLDEVFTGDDDKEQKIALLQQWAGYCLVPDSSQQKFLWLVGVGGNGKSVFLSILEQLVGPGNVTHAHIEQLGKKFVRAELEGKLLNISSEIGINAKMADGYLKQIVGGDAVQAERKFKPSFSFRPYARMVAATNHLPVLKDLSEGFFRRALIMNFNRQFSVADRDIRLLDTLRNELPGILVWAIDGLKALREQGAFTIPPSSVLALQHYRKESDQDLLYVESHLSPVTEGGLTASAIFLDYCKWCKTYGFTSKNITAFGKRLSSSGFSSRRSNGKRYWLVESMDVDDAPWIA